MPKGISYFYDIDIRRRYFWIELISGYYTNDYQFIAGWHKSLVGNPFDDQYKVV
jgi:hypothetical protein